MKTSDITDALFRQGIEAIDSGNIAQLEGLISEHPFLVKERLQTAGEGYFKDPYLICFVADNPIRNSRLPPNIVAVTRLLVDAIKRYSPETYQRQIDYALGLIATGCIPRECGVQIALMDVLMDAGAEPGNGMAACANGNLEAARHLIERGGKLTLAGAVCLEREGDIGRLAAEAGSDEKLTAIAAAAFYGKEDVIRLLLTAGADPNGYPQKSSGFHSHATPLHQAVASTSLNAVKLLVEAGARLDAADKIYDGTPLDWALHLQADDDYEQPARRNFGLIAEYLRSR
jgi:hypothetical protein